MYGIIPYTNRVSCKFARTETANWDPAGAARGQASPPVVTGVIGIVLPIQQIYRVQSVLRIRIG